MTRRELGALAAGALIAASTELDAQTPEPPLDIAEWCYHWYGVEHALLARGTVCNGMQMYVEHWIPAQVRHPYPVVLIHGGFGQGSDWFSTSRRQPRLGHAVSGAGLQGLRARSPRPGPQSVSAVRAWSVRSRKRRRSKRSARAMNLPDIAIRESPRPSRPWASRCANNRERRRLSGARAGRCCSTISARRSW